MRYLFVVLLLAGCALDETPTEADKQAAYHQKCVGYGLSVGTEAYALCRQRFDETDRQERAMRRAIILNGMMGK